MNKKVLAVCYSQTGQLADIIGSLIAPMNTAGLNIEILRVYPEAPYPFPWPGKQFFAQMPDCVLRRTIKLQPVNLSSDKYDLIILGYQAWFLSPSIPSNTILQDSGIRAVLKDTPVVTVTGARNMWLSAMEDVKVTLKDIGANLVGNIALTDKHHNLLSIFTIAHWMFSGRKDRLWGVFPLPGVSDKDVARASIFGDIITRYFLLGKWEGLQDELIGRGAVEIKYSLMFIESKAKRIFGIWARIISRKKNKAAWLIAFKYYLIIALFVAAPIILALNTILIRPFFFRKVKRQKLYYSGIK